MKFTLKDKPNETFIGKGIDNKGLLIAQNDIEGIKGSK